MVTVTLTGAGFEDGATVTLVKSGDENIVGKSVVVTQDARQITTSFDLTGKALGLWDVVVTNPTGTAFTLPGGFTIEQGHSPELWADLVGHGVIRIGRQQKYHVAYGNKGNIDSPGGYIFLAGIPNNADIVIESAHALIRLPKGLEDDIDPPVLIQTRDEKILPIFIGRVPPASTEFIELGITVLSAGQFTLETFLVTP